MGATARATRRDRAVLLAIEFFPYRLLNCQSIVESAVMHSFETQHQGFVEVPALNMRRLPKEFLERSPHSRRRVHSAIEQLKCVEGNHVRRLKRDTVLPSHRCDCHEEFFVSFPSLLQKTVKGIGNYAVVAVGLIVDD